MSEAKHPVMQQIEETLATTALQYEIGKETLAKLMGSLKTAEDELESRNLRIEKLERKVQDLESDKTNLNTSLYDAEQCIVKLNGELESLKEREHQFHKNEVEIQLMDSYMQKYEKSVHDLLRNANYKQTVLSQQHVPVPIQTDQYGNQISGFVQSCDVQTTSEREQD